MPQLWEKEHEITSARFDFSGNRNQAGIIALFSFCLKKSDCNELVDFKSLSHSHFIIF